MIMGANSSKERQVSSVQDPACDRITLKYVYKAIQSLGGGLTARNQEPSRGDLLVFKSKCTGIRHWAVYLGDGELVHYNKNESTTVKSEVIHEKLSELVLGAKGRLYSGCRAFF